MDAATLKALNDERLHNIEEIRSLYDDAAGREMTAEERATEERLSGAVSEADRRIAAALDLMEAEKRTNEAYDAAGIEAAATKPAATEERSLFEQLNAGEIRSAEFSDFLEVRADGEQEKKTQYMGGETVADTFQRRTIEYAQAFSGAVLPLAEVLRTAGGEDVIIPRVTDYPEAVLVAEAASLTKKGEKFDQVTVGAYKYGFIQQVSYELENDTAIDLAGLISRLGGQALGTAVGKASVTGTGSSQPLGIIANSGGLTSVQAATGSVAAGFSTDDVLTIIMSVDPAYRRNGAFICNDTVIATLRKLKGTDGQYVWQENARVGEPATLFGYPVYSDAEMPTTQTNGVKGLAFGDFGQAVIVRWAGPLRIETSKDYSFGNDVTSWRFLQRFDSRVKNANAAKVLTYRT